MGMNLMHSTDSAADNNKANWEAITKIAPMDGIVYISEATVNQIARLLKGATLSNGETVCAYVYDDEDPQAALVCSFGPGLLGEDTFRQMRTALELESDQAVALFDTIVELGLQISLSGKEFTDAHIQGVNWIADEVEIRRSSGNLFEMLDDLGVPYDSDCGGEVDFETFKQAVNDNGAMTDMPERLQAFVACAERNNAKTVCWA